MEQATKQFFNLIRKCLYHRLHALARPLSGLTDVLCEPGSPAWEACFGQAPGCACATDGKHVFWNPRFLKGLSTEEKPDPGGSKIESCCAGFSACGGLHQQRDSVPPQCDPPEGFLSYKGRSFLYDKIESCSAGFSACGGAVCQWHTFSTDRSGAKTASARSFHSAAVPSLRWGRPCDPPEGFLSCGERSFLYDKKAGLQTEALLLHQTIHCLFGHPFSMPPSCPPDIWSLACDISAWHILGVWIPGLLPGSIQTWLNTFSGQFPELPLCQARKVAGYLAKQPQAAPPPPLPDCHRLWPVFRQNRISSIKKETQGDGEGNGKTPCPGQRLADTAALWKRLQKQLTGKNAPLSPRKHPPKKPGAWGDTSGGGTRKVCLSDTRRHNYRDILKSLASWGEEMKPNSSDFQYAPYLYGLEHYGGMPLLEPLEYEETAKIRELAIVIDTSASCSHSLTQAFLEETRNLLLEEDLFFHPFNLHILQCDKEVERDDKLTSPEDLKDYTDALEICGMGGTDFRPAFSYIRRLQDCREFTNLPAILFFTDGSGLYPSKPPGVRTIFIFLNGHYEAIDVPDWAETLVLETEERNG